MNTGEKTHPAAFAQIAFFVAIWSLTALVLHGITRLQLGDTPYGISVLAYLRVWCFTLSLPAGVLLAYHLKKNQSQQAIGWALGALSVLLGMIFFGPILPFLLDAMILALAGFVLWQVWRQASQAYWMVGLMGIFGAIGHYLLQTKRYIGYPLQFELSFVGGTYWDTLFHATVAHSLIADGVASASLDGRVPFQHHVLSHRLIGSLTQWLDVEMLQGFSLALSGILGPTIMGGLLCAALLVARAPRGGLAPVPATFGLLNWLLFFGLFAWCSYFKSELYAVSLIFVLLALPVIAGYLRNEGGRERYVMLVLLPVLVFLAASSKISTGAVLGVGVAAAICFAGRFSLRAIAVAVFLGGVPIFLDYGLGRLNNLAGWGATYNLQEKSFFALFNYARNFPIQVLVHVGFVVILSLQFLRHLPTDRRERDIGLALLAMMWAAICASSILNVETTAPWYFLNPSMWIGLVLMAHLSLASNIALRLSPKKQSILMVVFFALMNVFNFELAKIGLFSVDRAWNALEAGVPDGPGSLGARLFSQTELGQAFHTMKQSEQKIDGVHVAADNPRFWTLYEKCWPSSYIFPATLGIPMLMGRPPRSPDCEETTSYGMAQYPPEKSSARPLTDSDLVVAAQARGMATIAVLRADGVLDILPGKAE